MKSLATFITLTAISAAAAIVGVAPAVMAANNQTDQKDQIKLSGWSTVQKIVQTFQSDSKLSASAQAAQLNQLIDYHEIAYRSLSEAEWKSLNSAQRLELTATIRTLVEHRYYPRWQKIFGRGQVLFVAENKLENKAENKIDPKAKSDSKVRTTLRLGQKDDPLDWQLSNSGGSPRLISLAINQKDLLITLRQRIEAHQTRGGYNGMIAWLKGKGGQSDPSSDLAAQDSAAAADSKLASDHSNKKSAEKALKSAAKSGALVD